MKRLSSNERWGVSLIALVAIIIVAASIVINRNANQPLPPIPQQEVIYSPDSVAPDSLPKKHQKGVNEKKNYKNKQKKKAVVSSMESKTSARDLLSDPINTESK